MPGDASTTRVSRETRLLLVTITISLLVLLLLSRLRFPEAPSIVEALPPPLERLAARATYDELAGIVASLKRRISPNLVVIRLASRVDTQPRVLADVLGSTPSDETFRHVPALRVSETTAFAALGSDARIVGLVGKPAGTDTAELIATDTMRRLSLLRVTPSGPDSLPQLTLSDLETPPYVVVVEGTRAGLTFRPVFIGTDDRFSDPRWERPLLAVSSIALTSHGALVFSLEGQFLGCAVVEDGTLAIAGARDILAAVASLSTGATGSPVDFGLAVQALTSAIAATLGVDRGVVVAEVSAIGPAHGILQPRDVITDFDDQPVGSADDFLLRIARSARGAHIMMAVVRGGRSLSVTITLPQEIPPVSNTDVGMELQFQRGDGSVVTAIVGGSNAAGAGLHVGDLIVEAGGIRAPSPAQLNSLLHKLESGAYLLLRVQRAGRERFLALAGPSLPDRSR
jgi:hypothetical protein